MILRQSEFIKGKIQKMALEPTNELAEFGNRCHPQVQAILPFFSYGHLPERQAEVLRIFHDAALSLLTQGLNGPELTTALRKLLEAKDAAVRASL